MKGLNLNWKELRLRYRKDPQGLDEFIASTKNDLASMLVRLTYEQALVDRIYRRIVTQKKIKNEIRSQEDLWGCVNFAIAEVAYRWESYCRNYIATGKPLLRANGEALDMDSFDSLVGYYKTTLRHQIVDIFDRVNAQKRDCSEINMSSFSYDGNEFNGPTFEETLVSREPVKREITKKVISIVKGLRVIDRSEGTKMARLFAFQMNPRNEKVMSHFCVRAGISHTNAKKQEELLKSTLAQIFADDVKELQSLWDQVRDPMDELKAGYDKEYKNGRRSKSGDEYEIAA